MAEPPFHTSKSTGLPGALQYLALAKMNQKINLLLIVLLVGCADAVPYRNSRPMTPMPPARELIPQCKVTVQFNEDEASVPESKYLDSMFCLGVMEGILSTNSYLSTYTTPMFCPPNPGIKTWIAAKAVVEFADLRPDLLNLEEGSFAIQALAAKYPCKEPKSKKKKAQEYRL